MSKTPSGWRDRQGQTRTEREKAERLTALNEKFQETSERAFGPRNSLLRPALAGLAIGGALFLVLTNWDGLANAGSKALVGISKPTYSAPTQPNVSVSTWSYSGCREARAAGAAPVYRGQPGYGPHLDSDGDGIGCEPYYR